MELLPVANSVMCFHDAWKTYWELKDREKQTTAMTACVRCANVICELCCLDVPQDDTIVGADDDVDDVDHSNRRDRKSVV